MFRALQELQGHFAQESFARKLRTVWVCRFPIGFIALLVLLGPIGLTSMPTVLGSGYLISNWAQMTALTTLCLLSATVFVVQVVVVSTRGKARFIDLRHQGEGEPAGKPSMIFGAAYNWNWPWRRSLVLATCGLAFPLTCFLNSMRNSDAEYLVEQEITLAGGVVGLFLGIVVYFLFIQIFASIHTIFYRAKDDGMMLPMKPFVKLDLKSPFEGRTSQTRGHFELMVWLMKYLCGYVVIYLLTRGKEHAPEDVLTAPFYLVLLLTLWCLVITAIAYFLDYYRVSILFVGIVAFLVFHQTSDFDHRFPVIRKADSRPSEGPDPKEKKGGQAPEDEVVIVVVAPGGGIHASAWTGRVLAGLHDRYKERFEKSLKLISAVSGGSVGAMFYLDNYPMLKLSNQTQNESKEAREKFARTLKMIVRRSSTSSLEALAWGATFPDTARLIFGSWVTEDRGFIQEIRWLRRMDVDDGYGPTMMEWRSKALRNDLPWVAFNATEAETGRRILFSTMQFDSSSAASLGQSNLPDEARPIDFITVANNRFDLPIATAVRLSATFPYASPAAMPASDTLPFGHVVDGGYADNDGLLTAIEAIRMWHREDQARSAEKTTKKTYVVVRIDHMPPLEDRAVQVNDPGLRGAGWEYAAVGPLVAMGNVRTTSQRERGEIELQLLKETMKDSLRTATIQFPKIEGLKAPPLNWKLSSKQRNSYQIAWSELTANADQNLLRKKLANETSTEASESSDTDGIELLDALLKPIAKREEKGSSPEHR